MARRPHSLGITRLRVTANLCSFDGCVDVALGLPLQLFHSKDAFHFLYQAHVAYVRRSALVDEYAVGVGIAQGLQNAAQNTAGRDTRRNQSALGSGYRNDARMAETRGDRSRFLAVGEEQRRGFLVVVRGY